MSETEQLVLRLLVSHPEVRRHEAMGLLTAYSKEKRAEALSEAIGVLREMQAAEPDRQHAAGLYSAELRMRRMAAAGRAPAPEPETRPDTDDGLARVCWWWRCHLTEPHPAHLGCRGLATAPQPETTSDGDGLREWQLTRDNLSEIDDQIDADGIYAKGYWEFVDGRNTVTGLRIGSGENRIVARFGDTIVRHANGTYSVRPAEAGAS